MLTVELRDRQAQRVLDRLSTIETRKVGEVIGAVLESQTRRRIADEKTSPDGQPWAAWSPAYAEASEGAEQPGAKRDRKGRFSSRSLGLLLRTGGLLDSIAYTVTRDHVRIGSNLVHAGVHQEGTDKIPARPYLGAGPKHIAEIVDAIEDYLQKDIAA